MRVCLAYLFKRYKLSSLQPFPTERKDQSGTEYGLSNLYHFNFFPQLLGQIFLWVEVCKVEFLYWSATLQRSVFDSVVPRRFVELATTVASPLNLIRVSRSLKSYIDIRYVRWRIRGPPLHSCACQSLRSVFWQRSGKDRLASHSITIAAHVANRRCAWLLLPLACQTLQSFRCPSFSNARCCTDGSTDRCHCGAKEAII